ncbi:hypothetical protein IHE44_0002210, partial [Lamprotornis superbus]
RLRGKAEVNQDTLQRVSETGPGRSRDWAQAEPDGDAGPSGLLGLLEENDQLIRCIVEYQSKGHATDCVHMNNQAKLEEMPAAGAQSLAHMGDWSICMVSLHWLTGLLMGYRDVLWLGSVLGTEDPEQSLPAVEHRANPAVY